MTNPDRPTVLSAHATSPHRGPVSGPDRQGQSQVGDSMEAALGAFVITFACQAGRWSSATDWPGLPECSRRWQMAGRSSVDMTYDGSIGPSATDHPPDDGTAGLGHQRSRVGGDVAGFGHAMRVRYADCDMQGVVFNATYLGYVDDAVDVWLQNALGASYLDRFDYVVKKAALEWSAAAGPRDLLTLRPSVTRWGTTSFDVTVVLDTACRRIAKATLTLISVVPGQHTPVAVPLAVRQALDPASTNADRHERAGP